MKEKVIWGLLPFLNTHLSTRQWILKLISPKKWKAVYPFHATGLSIPPEIIKKPTFF